jgi:F0F1-type ATP synthase delta subunit
MKNDVLVYYDLVTSLKTTREVENFTSEINNLKLTFFDCKGKSIKDGLCTISSGYSEKITQIFAKSNLDINDKDAFSGFLETLRDLIKKLKVIKLVLAFDPAEKTIERIHGFVKENVGIGYILDIEVSPSVLGGATVIFDGKYNDYSLKKKIEDTFKTKIDLGI